MESNRHEFLTNAAWAGMVAMALCAVPAYADSYDWVGGANGSWVMRH